MLYSVRLETRKHSDLLKQVAWQLSAGHDGYCFLAHWNMTSHDSVLISPTLVEPSKPAGCPRINILTLSDSSVGLCQGADLERCFVWCGVCKYLK